MNLEITIPRTQSLTLTKSMAMEVNMFVDGIRFVPGPPGEDGTGFRWLGDYSDRAVYVPNDVILWPEDGNCYINVLGCYGVLPDVIMNWEMFVSKGDIGAQGPQGNPGPAGADGDDGYTPVKGVDYFDGEKGDKGDTGSFVGTMDNITDGINYVKTENNLTDTEKNNLHAPGSDNQDLSGLALSNHNHSGVYEPAKGTDDNYVTDTEKSNLHAPGSDNQDLSGLALSNHNHSGVYEPAKGTDDNYVTDTEKSNLHAPGSDNQDLSGLEPKQAGKSLSTNDLTNVLKQAYDNAYAHSMAEHLQFSALGSLIAGLGGIDCVLSGLAITAGAAMVATVAKGAVLSNKIMYAVAEGTATITAADATNPRIDLVVITSEGAIAVRAGTPAPYPLTPTRSANDVVLYSVLVPAGDTVIGQSQFTDMRVIPSMPQIVYRTTTAEVTNTTSAQINALNKTGSGVVIPNGLLLAGRMLRVKLGGNFLWNSGTPTTRLEIIFGGTTMFSSISGVATADADRTAWALEFIIVAQANNDQALSGLFWSQILGAKTAPTAGIGPVWAATALGSPIGGSSAQDCAAANRTLQVMFTFNVSNSANELVVEYATVELI